jgi:SAM-dependent methyltransferase
VVHEVPDAAALLAEIGEALAPGGRLLIAEPKGHVSEEALEKTVAFAEKGGLAAIDRPDIRRSRAVLLERPRG